MTEYRLDAMNLLEPQALFFQTLFGDVKTIHGNSNDPSKSRKAISFEGSDGLFMDITTLIIRPCYDHLLPHIHNALFCKDSISPYKFAVTGTPGVGKTIFGVYMVRHFVVREKKTVLYWLGNRIFLFSFDDKVKDACNLKHELTTIDGRTLYCGKWNTVHNQDWVKLIEMAEQLDIWFIHDPNEGDTRVSEERASIPNLVFVLSYGHSLISQWNSKGFKINYFYMPLWTQQEALDCLDLLGVVTNDAAPKKVAADKFFRFGGCIRAWVSETLWDELRAKISEVVKKLGDDVLKKTTSSRGSVIHQHVDFDEKKPPLDFVYAPYDPPYDRRNDLTHNTFTKEDTHFIFGSEEMMILFYNGLTQRSDEAFKNCLRNWAGENGFESVYGAMFELYCHRQLENANFGQPLNMRIVYADDTCNTKNIYEVRMPRLGQTVRYPSNDPALLGEPHIGDVDEFNYFWPTSSTHPTYDSATVVTPAMLEMDKLKKSEDGLKELKKVDRIALLLQMTVSGATGLPRRPKHSVRRQIREKFRDAFNQKIPSFKANGLAVTTFMVPTACFMPFLYQHEDNPDGSRFQESRYKKPASFQLVIEVPEVFKYGSSPRYSLKRFDFDDIDTNTSSNSKKRKRRDVVHRFADT